MLKKKKKAKNRKWLIHYFKVRHVHVMCTEELSKQDRASHSPLHVQDRASHSPLQVPPCGRLMEVLTLFQWLKKEHLEVWGQLGNME